MKIIIISGCSAPITGLVPFIWSMQSQALNFDLTGRDIAEEDTCLVAGFLPDQSGQY